MLLLVMFKFFRWFLNITLQAVSFPRVYNGVCWFRYDPVESQHTDRLQSFTDCLMHTDISTHIINTGCVFLKSVVSQLMSQVPFLSIIVQWFAIFQNQIQWTFANSIANYTVVGTTALDVWVEAQFLFKGLI